MNKFVTRIGNDFVGMDSKSIVLTDKTEATVTTLFLRADVKIRNIDGHVGVTC